MAKGHRYGLTLGLRCPPFDVAPSLLHANDVFLPRCFSRVEDVRALPQPNPTEEAIMVHHLLITSGSTVNT
ncbi:hypothetical protein Baya_12653 [Bagarius yarrelli]|uniref:Uncharacterized protein n=1 Tax=Bagarius yarrelli TaxID=175774 RepID=A0A556V4G1_BAGYA|nr:hypothetical protein Baya_12653 [Bagarius yarrelli]